MAFRELEEHVGDVFPLPKQTVRIRWMCPKANKGDFVMYTGFHGNVASVR